MKLTRQSFIGFFSLIPSSSNDNPQILRSETPVLQATLQREIELLRERLADKDAVIDDLRKRLDREGEERRRLTAILTDQRAQAIITPPPAVDPSAPAKRGWWRIGGRAAAK